MQNILPVKIQDYYRKFESKLPEGTGRALIVCFLLVSIIVTVVMIQRPLYFFTWASTIQCPTGTTKTYVCPDGVQGKDKKALCAWQCIASTIIVPTPTPAVAQTPYGGSPITLPGKIEAENYDLGGEGIAYHDLDTANQGGGAYRTMEGVDTEVSGDTSGGYNVGWIKAGEWLEYTVDVTTVGTYALTTRVASAGLGGTFHVEIDGANISGTLTIPNTGGWQIYQNVTVGSVPLSAGRHILKVAWDVNGSTGYVGNLNYLTIAAPGAPTPTVAAYCGDGVKNGTESCDGTALGGATCQTLGFGGGILSCNTNCSLNTSSCTTLSSDTVTIDFAADLGPVTYRASGFIGADISDTLPSDTLFLPLKPQTLSWVMNYKGINRATQNNIRYQIKLWNKSAIPSSATGDWSVWEKYVSNLAQTALNQNYRTVEFDLWNEPDCCGYWDGAVDERYFQMWNRAYRIIKSVSTNFTVVGPSISYNKTWMKNNFLPRVKTDGTLPDVLSWHEINDGGNIASEVASMRSYLQANGINISRISINEYDTSTNAQRPGMIVRFMDQLEKAKVDSSARACWEEEAGGSYECAPHLDNLLTYPGQQRRSGWWTYKAYADMTGSLVPVYGTTSMVGVAAKDANLKKGYVLLGSVISGSSVTLKLTNIDKAPFFIAGAPVKVLVQRIPNTEKNALSAPVTVQQVSLTPSGTTLTLPLTGIQLYDAYNIILTQ